MTIVLEDYKGFTKIITVNSYHLMSEYKIAAIKQIKAFSDICEPIEIQTDTITFYFNKWLYLNQVALYKEE